MNRDVSLGVDPGLKGALAFWHPKAELLETFPMPTLTVTRNGTERGVIDIYALAHIIRPRAEKIRAAFVELVGTMPQQGVASGFTFGKVTGIVIGQIAAHLVPLEEIAPAKWKRHMGVTADKDSSRRRASLLLPLYAPRWTPPTHNKEICGGIAEATLIALYGANLK